MTPIQIATTFGMMVGLAALGCGKPPAGPPATPQVAPAPLVEARLPTVTVAAALAAPDAPLPAALVLLDASGALRVAPPPASWTEPLAQDPRGATAIDLAAVRVVAVELRAGMPYGMPYDSVVGELDQDEPPPPPPPEEVDEADEADEVDEADDSGGTGTAMALDEGRMGTAASDRAEGQYKMQRSDPAAAPDPQLALDAAVELARSASILGAAGGGVGFGRSDAAPVAGVDVAERLTQVSGWIADDGRIAPGRPRMMVVADPGAKARALVDVLAAARGYLAVRHQGGLRVLRVDFSDRRFEWATVPAPGEPWLEVQLSAGGLAFEGVAEVPTAVAWPAGAALDAAAVAAAWTQVRARRGLGDRTDVDVLVTADTDVQRLVDLLVALDAAGARNLGLGATPDDGSAQATARGRVIPRVWPGQLQTNGDLDKAVIRGRLKEILGQLDACHAKTLAVLPEATGTVVVQFFITPNGHVGTAAAAGVVATLADCVAAAIKATEFPKPKGGGGVQVSYSLRFTH